MHSDPVTVKATSRGGRRSPSEAGLAVACLSLVLILPLWWRDGAWGSQWLVAEAWFFPALLAALAGKPTLAWLRWPAAFWVVILIAVICGDALLRQVLSRPLNLALDPLLLRAGFHLISGAIGTWAAVLASLLLSALVITMIFWLARRLHPARLAAPRPLILAMLMVGLISLVAGPWLSGAGSVSPGLVLDQAAQLKRTAQGHRALVREMDSDRLEARPLARLAGRDVYLVFVESYGISALDKPRYGDRLLPLLEKHQSRLAEAGFSSVSGLMQAPIRGGQSWLSHATVLSGLRIDNDHWYKLMLDRLPASLADDFSAAGHRPMVLAPAIVFDWPQAEALGFDVVHAAADMQYQGPPLGWVTMPDQYTLDAFSRQLRPGHDQPVFAMLKLISSHAPWTPVIEPIEDWSTIDDGALFERWRDSGENPLRLWFDPPALRQKYLASLEYSLTVTFDWIATQLDRNTLIIVLGDHQAASIITGRDASAAVPVHVISANESLLEPFKARGWLPGLRPDLDDRPADMATLRQWLREDFGEP